MTHTIKRNKTLGIDEVFNPSGECVGQIHKFGSFWYPNDHTRPGGHLIGGKRVGTLREARLIALEYFSARAAA